MTTITKEWLQQTIAEFENTRDDIPFGLDDDDAKILIVLKRALAALTAEPVAWTDAEELRDLRTFGFCEMFTVEPISKDADMYRVIPLYTVSQPVPERERIRREHAEWSDATFGDVGPIGPLKHLSKEALEAAADPSDPLEWADMQFLLWDAQRRMGISDEFITRAMIEKLEINKSRQWPEPKEGEPRLHVQQPQNAQQNIPENISDRWVPKVGDYCEVQTDQFRDVDWVTIKVIAVHGDRVAAIVQQPNVFSFDEIEIFGLQYDNSIFRPIINNHGEIANELA